MEERQRLDKISDGLVTAIYIDNLLSIYGWMYDTQPIIVAN